MTSKLKDILPHIKKGRMTPHSDMDGQSFFEWLLNESESHLLATAMQKEYSTLRSYAQRIPRYGERGGGRPSPFTRLEELIGGFRRLRWSWHIRQIKARVIQRCDEALSEIEGIPAGFLRNLTTEAAVVELLDQSSKTLRAITEDHTKALIELENLMLVADAIRQEIRAQHNADTERISHEQVSVTEN